MRTKIRVVFSLVFAGFFLSSMGLAQAGDGDWFGRRYRGARAPAPMGDKLQLSFSFGEGATINTKCSRDGGCESVMVTPADFEILAGYKLNRWFALDLGIVWAVDFDYYDRVTYMTGVRPGVRFMFPLLYHRMLYLRAALPLLFGINDENDDFFVGLLLGIGVEWRFGPVGLFGEVDFTPFFVELYPGYYAFPVQGRIGLAIHF